MASCRYVGDVPEIRGRTFQLPDGMPLSKATAYCEQVWFSEQLEAELRDEAANAEIATAEAQAMADVVEGPEEPAGVDITPAAADPAPQAIGAADAIAISRELAAQRDDARREAERNAAILAEIRQAQADVAAEKAEILKCLKSNSGVMNEAFGSYGRELNTARVEIEQLRQQIASLKGGDQ